MSLVTRPAGEAEAATDGTSVRPRCAATSIIPPEAGAGAPVGLEDLAAVAEIAGRELAAIGGNGAERVGLVGDHGDEDAHATS